MSEDLIVCEEDRLRRARHVNNAEALRMFGLRDKIHPADVYALAYPDREYFDASAKRDREEHGNGVLGPREVPDGGVIGIVDLRPQLLAKFGIAPTDPSLPDDYSPKGKDGR